MITTILILAMILTGAFVWLGASLVCLVVTVVFKLLLFAVKFVLALGWGALLLASGLVLFLLHATGLFALAFLILAVMAVAWLVGTLLGGGRGKTVTPSASLAGERWSGYDRAHDDLRGSIARFERRLQNLETILSAR
jgi:hypothetical protein